ncbi:hypothetical protein BRC93_08755 [Halobacteriales archaeon QS_5_70_15]|nr:MAG: hypothetical protein BRC93_08755 [Halobacteriales archaeon QS_5_70_15]
MTGEDAAANGTDDALDVDGDALAGVVDLFGALTRAELERALEELAYKQGVEPPDSGRIDRATERYALVSYRPAGEDSPDDGEDGPAELVVPGPSAFPSLPPGAGDLPHIMDVRSRSVDRDAVGRAVEERFRADVARALASGDDELVGRLLDVSYDLDAWGLEMGDLRARLDDARGD